MFETLPLVTQISQNNLYKYIDKLKTLCYNMGKDGERPRRPKAETFRPKVRAFREGCGGRKPKEAAASGLSAA